MKHSKRLVLLLIAATVIVAVLVVVFAVILPMRAQTKRSEAALDAIQNATPAPTAVPTPEPAPTPQPPWRVQVMRRYGNNGALGFLKEFDPEGRLLADEEDGVRREYTYDGAGNLVKLTNYRKGAEGENRVSSWKEYQYDADGRKREELTYHEDGNGGAYLDEQFSSTYDEHGNILRYEKSSKRDGLYEWEDYSYTYDEVGRIVKEVCTGTHVSDGACTQTDTYRYDAEGRLLEHQGKFVTERETQDPYSEREVYEYNESGLLVKETEYWMGALNMSTVYAYDEQGRLIGKEEYSGGELSAFEMYEYYDNGVLRSSSRRYGDGRRIRYQEFDENGRETDGDIRYTYDEAGRVVQKIDENDTPECTKYVYDEAGRLIRENYFLIFDGEEPWGYAEYEYLY